ncbi:MAG: cupin domain-containing protein [Candidatus Saliniplasma sp.]
MDIIDLNEIEPKEKFKPHRVIQQDEVQVVILPFKPGQGLKVHTTPVDVFFYIVEGKAEITVGDEVKQIEEGSIVLSPKDVPHNVRNTSDGETKVMVVKTPNPK